MELNKTVAAITSQYRYSLLMVDSATALFRTNIELSERQMQMAQFLSQLTRLVEEFGIAVLITNQIHVVASPGGMSFAKDATKSIGGYIVAHKINNKACLVEKGTRGESFLCCVRLSYFA